MYSMGTQKSEILYLYHNIVSCGNHIWMTYWVKWVSDSWKWLSQTNKNSFFSISVTYARPVSIMWWFLGYFCCKGSICSYTVTSIHESMRLNPSKWEVRIERWEIHNWIFITQGQDGNNGQTEHKRPIPKGDSHYHLLSMIVTSFRIFNQNLQIEI